VTIEYTYENRELLASRIYKAPGGAVLGTDTFTYHPNRLLSTAHGGLYNTDVDRSNLNADYDMANRLLAEVFVDDGAGGGTAANGARDGTEAVVANYEYDAFGRRVEKTVAAGNPLGAPAGVTRFYYSGQRVIEERDGADAVVAYYTYAGYIDEPVTMDVAQPPPAGGFARYYYHQNRMFSTYALTDAAGAVVERYTYTAYGQVTTWDAAGLTPRPTPRWSAGPRLCGRETVRRGSRPRPAPADAASPRGSAPTPTRRSGGRPIGSFGAGGGA
jgi:hypothetical protein